jgi:hypothetical protein
MKYPYLVASLPVITMDDVPAMRMDRFLEDAARLLTAEDAAELAGLLAEDPSVCQSWFAGEWFRFDRDLRHRIAGVRAGRLKLDPRTLGAGAGGGDALIKKAVLDAFARTNPMERELQLDQTRWRYLDELGRREPFGLGAVLAYGMQLRLAERWSGLSVEAGGAALDAQLKKSLAHQHVEAE